MLCWTTLVSFLYKKKISKFIKSAHFVLKLQQQFMTNIPHISNSKQHSAPTHAHSSCRGEFSFKICLAKFKDYKTQLFNCGTKKQVIYHLIKT